MLKSSQSTFKIQTEIENHVFKGTDIVKSMLSGNTDSILVYLDPDVDGVFSGYLVMKYLSECNIPFKWYINSNREHGWKLDISKVKGMLVIAVDFIVERSEVETLVDNGTSIINIDHHDNSDDFIYYKSNKTGKQGVVVNNQYPFEKENSRYLSGAGMVFETLIQCNPEFDTKLNRALVGITLLSDVRCIGNPLANGYLYELYHHKNSGYIKYLIDNTIGTKDFTFGVPRMDRNYVDFKFSPALNACFRFNQEEMVVNFILGSGYLDITYRDKQKELIKKLVDSVRIKDFSHLRVCYFTEEDVPYEYVDIISSFVGLVASKFLDGVHSVICYVIFKDAKGTPYLRRASFRGNINGLPYIESMGSLMDCAGHGSAFGIRSIKQPYKDTFLEVNRLCGVVEKESNYKRKIVEVSNLSIWVDRDGYEVALRNNYELSQNRMYIRYVGNNIVNKRTGGNYREMLVDGISVLCFESDISFDSGLLLPVLERGNICLYLEKYSG